MFASNISDDGPIINDEIEVECKNVNHDYDTTSDAIKESEQMTREKNYHCR